MAENVSSLSGSDSPGTKAPAWERLFPDRAHAFEVGTTRGDGTFFSHREDSNALLAERSRWLVESPAKYAMALPGSMDVIQEAAEFFGGLPRRGDVSLSLRFSDPGSVCAQIGSQVEPDWLLMAPSNGAPVFAAGCVCFPSFWSPEEKLGKPIQEIHGPVPGLNHQLGRAVDTFLDRLKPGVDWERWNWGMSASAERNAHPDRRLPRLDQEISEGSVWIRVEHQALRRLPRTGAILFGIRVSTHPIAVILESTVLKTRVRRQLETMDEAIAAYKGLATARSGLLRLLGA